MPSRESTFQPKTELARALIARRGELTIESASAVAGVASKTLSRIERGALGVYPSVQNAQRLAAYLGEDWDVGRVLEAAGRRPERPPRRRASVRPEDASS